MLVKNAPDFFDSAWLGLAGMAATDDELRFRVVHMSACAGDDAVFARVEVAIACNGNDEVDADARSQ
jgi:hypothetical protein